MAAEKPPLINLITGELNPISGEIAVGIDKFCYLDQSLSLLNSKLSILENFLLLNPDIPETKARRYLAQFLFRNVMALKKVSELSGGERLRAMLACVLMSSNPAKLLILDEPSNHLDIDSLKKIESVLKRYQGALIVISHDQAFLKNIRVNRIICAPFIGKVGK